MARAIWTGSISFGLVNIPVGLYSAVSEKTIRFHQLERGTSDRVRYKRVNENTGKEVEYHDIVKGYDVGGGQYVILSPSELEAVEPTGTRTIEIEDFVEQAGIDPIFYNQTYYVAPKTDAAARPYGLLIEAMSKSDKVAIASFVMRSREHLAALRADGDVLVLETMYFADEIRDPSREIEVRPRAEPARERELTTAISLIESMSTTWDPANYHDRYRARVEELIDQKLQGEQVVIGRRPEHDTNVVDLMDALRRSVDRVRDTRKDETEHAKTRSRAATNKTAGAAAKTTQPEKQHHAARRTRGRRPQGEQLAMMSREELYQLAQSNKVPGRSKMNRDELARAVANAQASRQAS
ncbi:MAG: non-homologous end joining protein Ku [Acidimicrobiales bacterium]